MLRRFAALAAIALAMPASAAHAAGLPRMVSMNVCTDQLLLTLADPEQIIGLSRFSRDGWQSLSANDMRRYPVLSGGAEDVLLLQNPTLSLRACSTSVRRGNC